MRIDLDPARIRDTLKAWREAIDLRVPMRDDLKIHIMENRKKILGNYIQMMTGWMLLLTMASAKGEDELDLHETMMETAKFKKWVQDELDQLTKL